MIAGEYKKERRALLLTKTGMYQISKIIYPSHAVSYPLGFDKFPNYTTQQYVKAEFHKETRNGVPIYKEV
jgi:hypothetical protein